VGITARGGAYSRGEEWVALLEEEPTLEEGSG
jgi:hypothetical protein